MHKLLLASCIFLLAACGSNNTKEDQAATVAAPDSTQLAAYACPMKCEGDKTYPQAGKCPVCKMDLQEVALTETDSTEHNH